MTDPQPAVRLQVLEHLHEASDLDPGVWLRRLSHDSAPACARLRYAQPQFNLSSISVIAWNKCPRTIRVRRYNNWPAII